jgi:hypothetical protein
LRYIIATSDRDKSRVHFPFNIKALPCMSLEKSHATKCTAVVVTLVIIFFDHPVGGHERCSIGASELEGIQRQRRNDLRRISPQYSKKVQLVKHKT